MSGIRTNAAAELLGVSPNTLRSWERRFGYPEPRRTAGGHRQYDLAELEALRRALLETHNISSAIQVAQQRGEGPSSASRLLEAFDAFDDALADRHMEESLSLRSVVVVVEPGADSVWLLAPLGVDCELFGGGAPFEVPGVSVVPGVSDPGVAAQGSTQKTLDLVSLPNERGVETVSFTW